MTDPDLPRWFRRATATPFETHCLEVDGVDINVLTWGEVDRPGLLFVHGGGAHAHWWSFLVPLLTDDYRVAAMDMSGHGDSGWRAEGYELDGWAAEVAAVAESPEAAFAGPPIIVGHSMGGFVAATTAALFGTCAGTIILDSPIQRPDPEIETGNRPNFAHPKTYSDPEEAVGRFRTVPPQEHYEPYVMDYVARRSLRQVEGGWTWKFDPKFPIPGRSDPAEMLGRIKCRVALFRSEYGLVTPDIGAYMYEQLGRRAPVIEVPEAGHHVMLDQPLLLLTGLRTLLADWEHSSPRRRS